MEVSLGGLSPEVVELGKTTEFLADTVDVLTQASLRDSRNLTAINLVLSTLLALDPDMKAKLTTNIKGLIQTSKDPEEAAHIREICIRYLHIKL